MEKDTKLSISESYLNQVLNHRSKSLVGKLLKRFEIIEDKNTIKNEAKELIYEEFRMLREVIIAYDKGLEMSIFEFKTKPREE